MGTELQELRGRIRAGAFDGTTSGRCTDRVHANLLIVPGEHADDFESFCASNPGPCPLLERTLRGSPTPSGTAPGGDLRTDLPRYRVYRAEAGYEEMRDITSVWRDDLVAFLLGCSFNFESKLVAAGIPMRHQEQGCVVPMYRTTTECKPAGVFSGPLVVSMRPVPIRRVTEVVRLTEDEPLAHGSPVAIDAAATLGIRDLDRPDYGDAVELRRDEVPVFWACGVTSQAVASMSVSDLVVGHAPGHMFVTDLETSPGASRARGS